MTETTSGASAGYRVLARKYRPQTFADLIGQEAMVRTLTNAFASNRIAQAYMLTGVRGVGKTTTARLIARALNYGDQPTIEMTEFGPHCQAILESRHIDVLELDAASNTGVDNMREIIEGVRYKPASARYKVYIIDEVHMLSKSAFNALLKTLEEPPPHVKFLFATTELRKVPVTVLSRCQRFDLKRLSTPLLMSHFARICGLEQVEAEDEALRLIARAAEGSVRDGLSLLDQAIVFGEGRVRASEVQAMMGLMDRTRVIDLFDAVMAGDPARALKEFEDQYQAGGDPRTTIVDFADFVHWVTRLKVGKDAASDPARSETERSRGLDYAGRLSMAHLSRAWQMCLKGVEEVERHANPLIAAEMLLIRLAHAAALPTGEDLLKLAREGRPGERPALGASVEPIRREAAAPMPSRSGPVAAVSVAPAPADVPPPSARLTSFQDVVALAGERRDIKLKSDLERYVRPIRVAPGQVELALEPGAPATLTNELARKLEAWTGQRWMVLVAPDGGARPLGLQASDARAQAFREAREHPDVRAILGRFPGAEITEVKLPEAGPAAPDHEEMEKD